MEKKTTALTLNSYQELANRTISPEGHQHFFEAPKVQADAGAWLDEQKLKAFKQNVGLLHALTKISEEAGEMWKPVNRAMWYGRDLGPDEIKNIREEAGDLLWYLAGPLCRALGCTLEEIARGNVEKLQARYPDKYTDEHALSRKDKQQGLPLNGSNYRRKILSAENLAQVLAQYKHSTVEDGFYYDDDEKAWIRIEELWELVTA